MKLTKEDRADLKLLVESPGFRILERIYEEKKTGILESFLHADLGKDKTRQDLYGAQNVVKGMETLIITAKGHSKEKVETMKSLR